jgi:3-hydroxyisobutyrate dehydrogenase-like beta-hydroxyacid dehydrogenase
MACASHHVTLRFCTRSCSVVILMLADGPAVGAVLASVPQAQLTSRTVLMTSTIGAWKGRLAAAIHGRAVLMWRNPFMGVAVTGGNSHRAMRLQTCTLPILWGAPTIHAPLAQELSAKQHAQHRASAPLSGPLCVTSHLACFCWVDMQ